MRIKPEELANKGYILLDTLSHEELIPFVKTYLKKKTKYSNFYSFINVLIFIISVIYFIFCHSTYEYTLGKMFSYFSIGIAIAFALIPVHEYIHVLAYKKQGAKNTSYGVNLKKFYFMALADKFVANKKDFEIIALAPFVVISLVLILLFFLLPNLWTFTIFGTFLTHTAMCSGDFGLLSYFELMKDKQVLTYDDLENKLSYFYGKE